MSGETKEALKRGEQEAAGQRLSEIWTEQDEARMDVIGQNGNEGLHYTNETKEEQEAVG